MFHTRTYNKVILPGQFLESGDSGFFLSSKTIAKLPAYSTGELSGNITSGEVSSKTLPKLMEESHLTENTVRQWSRVRLNSELVSSLDEICVINRKQSWCRVSIYLSISSYKSQVITKLTLSQRRLSIYIAMYCYPYALLAKFSDSHRTTQV